MTKSANPESDKERAERLRVQRAVGDQLRHIRLLYREIEKDGLAWSQEEVAARLGVSQPVYQRMEQGKTTIDVHRMLVLADKIYDRPVTYFYSTAFLDMGRGEYELTHEELEIKKAQAQSRSERKVAEKNSSKE